MSYLHLLHLVIPEAVLVLTAFVVLAADLLTMQDLEIDVRLLIGGMISAIGCVAAMVWLLIAPQTTNFMDGTFVVEPMAETLKFGLLALTLLTVLVSTGARFTRHAGEYYALLLLAAVGMMFLVSTEDILMIFVSLELTSLSLYILTGFNKRNIKSAEAALKYFLFGGMAAAFTLFGLSLLYGLTGATNLVEIGKEIATRSLAASGKLPLDPLLVAGIVMTVVGFGFKIAVVPFHLWAPDAYEGAPAPSAALVASGSKVASLFVFAKVMFLGLAAASGSAALHAHAQGWAAILALVAALSMVLGNLVAIVQANVRRLLAYSAIAHAGYMLLGILSGQMAGMAPLIYYVLTYGLTAVGAFAVVSVVEDSAGTANMADFCGLSRRSPVLSFCMMIFMLSLAGIPPLAGFFGKFYLFQGAIASEPKDLSLLWLVILAIATSAVSLYYYLKILKQIYVVAPLQENTVLKVAPLTLAAVIAAAVGVVLLGCAPNLLLSRLAGSAF